MRTLDIFFLTIIISFLILSCNSEKTEKVETKSKTNSDSVLVAELSKEMEEIDKAISQIKAFTSSEDKGEKSIPETIKEMEDLIISSNAKVIELENKLKKVNISSMNSAALSKSLEQQKNIINDQKAQIEKLTGKVIELEGKIVEKDSEIGGLKDSNTNLSKNVADAEKKLNQLNKDIKDAQQSFEKVQLDKKRLEDQINQEYFGMAKTLIDIAEDNKDIFKNGDNQRKEMSVKAYDYLCKLHKRGYYSALSEMTSLKSHKKLGKYVKNMNCN